MKQFIIALSGILLVTINSFAALEWSFNFDTNEKDYFDRVVQTDNESYLVIGATNYDYTTNPNIFTRWVSKFDKNGNIVWSKKYGTLDSRLYSVIKTNDGNYLMVSSENLKATLLKFRENGYILWEKSYGGSNIDTFNDIINTSDGGFVAVGSTYSDGAGENDGWIVKLDSSGNIEWQRLLGNTKKDKFVSVVEAYNGHFIVTGSTEYFSDRKQDLWVIDFYDNGSTKWKKTYGFAGDDWAYSIEQIYHYQIIGGVERKIYDGYIVLGHGNEQIWILNLTTTGDVVWQKNYKLNGNDLEKKLIKTDDGYIIAGEIQIPNFKTKLFLLKINSNGDIQWTRAYGKKDVEVHFCDVIQTVDNNFLLTGYAEGSNYYDGFLFKVNINGKAENTCNALINDLNAIVSNETPAVNDFLIMPYSPTELTKTSIFGTTVTNVPVIILNQCPADISPIYLLLFDN